MDVKIIVVIISSSIALLVTILSLLYKYKSERKIIKSNKELELYKIKTEMLSKSNSLKLEDIQKRVKILGDACTLVQKFRDNLRFNSDKENFNKLLTIIDDYITLYQDHHYLIPGLERQILHDVKVIFQKIKKILLQLNKDSSLKIEYLHNSLELCSRSHKILIKEFQKWNTVLQGISSDEVEEDKYFNPLYEKRNYLIDRFYLEDSEINLYYFIKEFGEIVELRSNSRFDVIKELIDSGIQKKRINNELAEDILKELFEREKIMSTAPGGRIALPHTRIFAVEKPFVMIGRSRNGVDWDALDGKWVNFVIMMVCDAMYTSIRLTSKVSRMFSDKEFVDKIIDCEINKIIDHISIKEENLYKI